MCIHCLLWSNIHVVNMQRIDNLLFRLFYGRRHRYRPLRLLWRFWMLLSFCEVLRLIFLLGGPAGQYGRNILILAWLLFCRLLLYRDGFSRCWSGIWFSCFSRLQIFSSVFIKTNWTWWIVLSIWECWWIIPVWHALHVRNWCSY